MLATFNLASIFDHGMEIESIESTVVMILDFLTLKLKNTKVNRKILIHLQLHESLPIV